MVNVYPWLDLSVIQTRSRNGLHNEQTGSIETSVQSYCSAFVIVET